MGDICGGLLVLLLKHLNFPRGINKVPTYLWPL